MATVLEQYTTEEHHSIVRFLWAKGLHAKDSHKEMFPVYGLKCLSLKALNNWVDKGGKPFAHDERLETELRKWLGQQLEDFYAAGFDARLKRWDKCISVGGYVGK
jgi:hypothetical protein